LLASSGSDLRKKPVSTISSAKLDQAQSRKSVLIQPTPDSIGTSRWAQQTIQNGANTDDDDSSHTLWDYVRSFFGQTKKPEPKQDIPPNLHLKMNELFSLHERLFEVGEQINNAYGIQIVSFITATFLITLFGFFFEIKVLFWKDGSSSVLQKIALSYVLWSLMSCLIVYTVLTICKTTREEAHESALIIHVVLQNKPLFMLNDEIYYNKMKSFTLQILHRKNIFNFHGLGLFYLDYTFIFSVNSASFDFLKDNESYVFFLQAVSAATSYLIVLLQFDLAPDFDNSIFGKGSNSTANFTGNVTI
jgi:7tm Chemosensory receptor